jgi:hypothetical protein
MDPTGDYLRIPHDYAEFLRPMAWSFNGEAIEYTDGGVFVFSPQLGHFLEGLTLDLDPIHFAFVLHFLHLLGLGKEKPPPRAALLARAFAAAGMPMRNAGVLCAALGHRLPTLARPLATAQLCRRLANPVLMGEWHLRHALKLRQGKPEAPPWDAAAFEAHVLHRLDGWRPDDLRHWFRHGREPVGDAGEKVAEQVPAERPRTLDGVLADLTRHPRLSGAVPFVAQLVSALALPPRRLARPELPLGGYADVTTRGHPEQLLPSQFAVDGLEFLRRFAENELLYFRREEPHARVREELVLVLDQGVRTWGTVRLVLAAAVLALGRLAGRKQIPFRVAATASGGKLLDPLEADGTALAELVQASDLSANPGLALETVLEDRGDAARDVVLLTHPRNLAEADVCAAARRAGAGTRVFALAVDEAGDSRLCELRHGTPVRLQQFRVDLTPKADVPVRQAPPVAGSWNGDVEPVGFPFAFGPINKMDRCLFDFDHEGEWVLQAVRGGTLHLWRSDGGRAEVLPRAFLYGSVLTEVEGVVGVTGGFVVGGRIGRELVAAHYDLARRTCTARMLGPADGGRSWFYLSGFHVVAARGEAGVRAVDLGTGGQFSTDDSYSHRGTSPRAMAAVAQWTRDKYREPQVVPVERVWGGGAPRSGDAPASPPVLRHDPETGSLCLKLADQEWTWNPCSEGRPVFQGRWIMSARVAGDRLAVRHHPRRGADPTLHAFRVADGMVLGEVASPFRVPGFLLSPDGRLLARQVNPAQLEVLDTEQGLARRGATPRAGCHPGVNIALGEHWFSASVGKVTHLVRWDGTSLKHTYTQGEPVKFLFGQTPKLHPHIASVQARAETLPACVRYDTNRWLAGAKYTLAAAVDSSGHVALFEPNGALVAMFFVFRTSLSAWLPDGTRYGPPAVIGGPCTPDAFLHLGAALRRACDRAEGRSP